MHSSNSFDETDNSVPPEPIGLPVGIPVVGIGASAGGLEAFQELLVALPVDTGMGFVLVQHLSPTYQSALAEILSRHTKMPVVQVDGAITIEPNRVYIIPPANDLVIANGELELVHRQTRGVHRPIDTFFQSLATDKRHAAIGVVLSGTANDGTAGLEAIKAEGGITFAQDGTAQHQGMPQSAIASGTVDFVLSPIAIAVEIARIATYLGSQSAAFASSVEPADLTEVLQALHRHTGVDFSQYKSSTVQRRVSRRMALRKADAVSEYIGLLKDTPEEVDALHRDILIGVTSFFRDPDAYVALKRDVFPRLVADRENSETVRMWSVGCATGQEAYSLAIAFSEFAEESGSHVPFQVFATDLNPMAIETARAGVYPEAALVDVGAERRRRYFTDSSGSYRIIKLIRDNCVFSHHNVAVDPPFSHLDLVSCRNLLIYLNAPLQSHVMATLHYALNPEGILWLGASESTNAYRDLFDTVDAPHRFFKRKLGAGRFAPRAALTDRREIGRNTKMPFGDSLDHDSADLAKAADRFLVTRFAPPAVVVSADLQILQFRGDTEPYLTPMAGKATLGLLSMLRRGLVGGVRDALQRATREHRPARETGMTVVVGGQHRTVTVEVNPIGAVGPGPPGFVVLFETETSTTDPSHSSLGADASANNAASARHVDTEMVRLTRELESTRDYLQSVIDQYEGANDALQSANEEAQSSNEELQSINEELETTKEEVQSSNEELVTLNTELRDRSGEVSRLYNDLTNLLASVEIAIVMVGADLRVRSFTPAAETLLKLIPNDVGRPLSDISLRFDGLGSIDALLADVLDSVRGRDMEFKQASGRWFSLRLRPYRTMDNRIDGVVVMFVDVDALKRSMEYALSIVATVHAPMLVLSEDLRVITASKSFLDTFAVTLNETESLRLDELGDGQWNVPEIPGLLATVIATGVPLEQYEVTHEFPQLGRRTMLFDARRLVQPQGMTPLLLVSIGDVTEQRLAEVAVRLSERRYRELFDSSPVGVYVVDADLCIREVNRAAAPVFVSIKDVVGRNIADVLEILWGAETAKDIVPHFENTLATGEPYHSPDFAEQRKDIGVYESYDWQLHRIALNDGRFGVVCHFVDSSTRVQLADALRERATTAVAADHRKDEFIALLAHELRNPLAPIRNALSVLQLSPNPTPIQSAATAIMSRQVDQLVRLVDDILDVSRASRGKVQLFPTIMDLVHAVQLSLDAAAPMIELQHHSISFDCPAEPVYVSADWTRIGQVVDNLLNNACKFTPRGGKITVTVTTESDQVELRVRDNGIGIAANNLTAIFDIFMQIDTTIERSVSGLGIGLSLVRSLVQLHGGTVDVRSAGLGFGTEFIVRLPLVESPSVTAPHAAMLTAPMPMVPLSVLVVDDNMDSLESMQVLLQTLGHDVHIARDGASAFTVAGAVRPDLVLLDIGLPTLNGYDACQQIRAEPWGKAMWIVALTGWGTEHDREKSETAGFDSHMVKPVSFEALTQLLADVTPAEPGAGA